jgi:hypothetical protein
MKCFKFCLLIIICLVITGCSSNETRSAISLKDFNNTAEFNEFTVEDNMKAYASVDYILEASLATYDDIVIEMIVYIDSEHASLVQEQHIESFNLLKSTGAMVEKEKGANYYEYSLISNNRYMVSTRVDNTLIFSKVMLSDKGIVVNLLVFAKALLPIRIILLGRYILINADISLQASLATAVYVADGKKYMSVIFAF